MRTEVRRWGAGRIAAGILVVGLVLVVAGGMLSGRNLFVAPTQSPSPRPFIAVPDAGFAQTGLIDPNELTRAPNCPSGQLPRLAMRLLPQDNEDWSRGAPNADGAVRKVFGV